MIATQRRRASDASRSRRGRSPTSTRELMARSPSSGIEVAIWPMPVEVAGRRSRSTEDERARLLRPGARARGSGGRSCRRTACSRRSAARFLGKAARCTSSGAASTWRSRASPAAPAPPHPGGVPNCPTAVMREAYSHEVSSAGFWPGAGPARRGVLRLRLPGAAGLPRPPGAARRALPRGAGRVPAAVRGRADRGGSRRRCCSFLQTTYEAAAELGGWDRRPRAPPGARRPVKAEAFARLAATRIRPSGSNQPDTTRVLRFEVGQISRTIPRSRSIPIARGS